MTAPTYFQLSGELYADWPDGRLAVYRSVSVPHGFVSKWVAIPAPIVSELFDCGRGIPLILTNGERNGWVCPNACSLWHEDTTAACPVCFASRPPRPSVDCPACDALNVCPSCAEKAR